MYPPPHRLSRIVVSVVLAVIVAPLSVLAMQAPAAADIPNGPPAQTGGVDGQVYATLVVGDTVYVPPQSAHSWHNPHDVPCLIVGGVGRDGTGLR